MKLEIMISSFHLKETKRWTRQVYPSPKHKNYTLSTSKGSRTNATPLCFLYYKFKGPKIKALRFQSKEWQGSKNPVSRNSNLGAAQAACMRPSYLLMSNSALSVGNTPMFTRRLLLSLGKWSTGFSRYRSGQWNFPALHNCPLKDTGSNKNQKLTTKADQDPGTMKELTRI